MIYHIDAYRLRDDDEFQQLGPDEYFESDGLVLIEWADRVERCLPRLLEIRIEVTGVESRRFEIRAVGRRYVGAIEAWPSGCGRNREGRKGSWGLSPSDAPRGLHRPAPSSHFRRGQSHFRRTKIGTAPAYSAQSK